MPLTDVFLTLGQDGFVQLMRSVSLGKLKTYQLYDRIKTRTHMVKLSSETLQKAAPRLWARFAERDEEYAQDLSQAVLVSHVWGTSRPAVIRSAITSTVAGLARPPSQPKNAPSGFGMNPFT